MVQHWPEKQIPDERLHQRTRERMLTGSFLRWNVLESSEGRQVLNILSPGPGLHPLEKAY